MSERAREPVFFEEVEEAPEPEPATEGAGTLGPPTAVGSGLGEDGGEDEPPGVMYGRRLGSGDEREGKGGPLGRGIQLTPDKYQMPIEDLDLSIRAYNVLRRSGLITVGQVAEKSEHELLTLRNFGRKSYDELRQRLDELGIILDDTGVN